MKYIKWLWHRAGDAKGSVTWNILLACISIGLNLFFIWLSKSLVDIATGSRTGSTLKLFAAILVATMLVRVFVNAARARLESNSVYRMQFIIRKDLFEGLIREQWNGKERFHSGDAVSRLFTDVDVVSKVICQDLPALIITIIQLAAAFIFLCTMDAKLAVILLLITPAFAAFGKIFFRRMRKLTKDIRESESNVQSHIQETLQHKTVVQSMGQELSMEEKLGGLQDTEYDQVLKRTKFNVFSRTAVSIAFGLGYSAAMLWGVFGIWQGAITFGVMTAFLQLVGQIQGPSMQLTRQIPSMIYAAASMDRLMEIENSEKEESGEQIMLKAPAGISVDHISFRYPDGKGWIFHDFSYDFKPGSRTAIVGETGIGKSTLIRLILSLLKPNGGEIRIYNESETRVTSALTRNAIPLLDRARTEVMNWSGGSFSGAMPDLSRRRFRTESQPHGTISSSDVFTIQSTNREQSFPNSNAEAGGTKFASPLAMHKSCSGLKIVIVHKYNIFSFCAKIIIDLHFNFKTKHTNE